MSVELLHWEVFWIATTRIVTLAGGLVGILLVTLFSKFVKDFVQLYIVVVCTSLSVIAITIVPYVYSRTAQEILLVMTALFLGVIEAGCHVISIAMVAKLVQSEMQGIAEALRLVFFYMARGLSGFIVSSVYQNIILSGGIVVFVNVCCAITLIFEIDYFMKNE